MLEKSLFTIHLFEWIDNAWKWQYDIANDIVAIVTDRY